MTGKLSGIEACVFDAYGTLFDFNTAAAGACDELGPDWQKLSDLWRLKQLQYTWLRGLAGHHAEFWQVTGDALDFALATAEDRAPRPARAADAALPEAGRLSRGPGDAAGS
jgi:2-haloacid dehalogenase